mgnify:CR=1 FL=1
MLNYSVAELRMNKVLLALLIMLTCSIIAPSAKDDSVRVGKVSNVMNVSNDKSVESDSLLLKVYQNF